MSESLDAWYQRELDFFREEAGRFATRFPRIANRLGLSSAGSRDPHVERLIQAFALLNARTRRKIDDGFPEFASAMLEILYPHMVAPIPSLTLAELELHPAQKELFEGYRVPRGTVLLSEPVETSAGDRRQCHFRTAYDVTLYPLEITEAEIPPRSFPIPKGADHSAVAESMIRVVIEPFDRKTPLSEFQLDSLTVHFNSNDLSQAAKIFELLNESLLTIVVVGEDGQAISLDPSHFRPLGYDENESLLPANPQEVRGYRLLTEYFLLPQKYLFAEITGLDETVRAAAGSKLEILFLLDTEVSEADLHISTEQIRLGATPAVNLFSRTSDAIPLSGRRAEHPIIPDARSRGAFEIYSVDDVFIDTVDGREQLCGRFFSVDHATHSKGPIFWNTVRRPGPTADATARPDGESEVYLSVVSANGREARAPSGGKAVAELTCFDRELPERLSTKALEHLSFTISGGQGPIGEVRCLRAPTPTVRQHLQRRSLWPLVSQLSLNHLSFGNEAEGLEVLRELLVLNDLSSNAHSQMIVEGVVGLKSRIAPHRLGRSFVNGTCLEVTLDDESFVGDSPYLFSSVLERFIAMTTSVNSYTQLAATTRARASRKDQPWKFPARSGTGRIL